MTLIFKSAAQLLKARKLLAGQYIDSAPARSPAAAALGVRGCGLRLSDGNALSEALALLKASGISPAGAVKEP